MAATVTPTKHGDTFLMHVHRRANRQGLHNPHPTKNEIRHMIYMARFKTKAPTQRHGPTLQNSIKKVEPSTKFSTPALSNQACAIVVKCRGIEYKHLGWLGAEHCDARVTDRSGTIHSLSGGPDGDPTNSRLNAWDTTNPEESFTGWAVYNNPNSCSLSACVINSTNRYHDSSGKPHYNGVSGPNSNTWLKDTFTGCGTNIPINTLGGIW